MAKKICKCAVCQVEFDRNAVQAVRHGARRYSHATCEPENTDFVPMEVPASQDPELKELQDYIAKIYGDKANWVLIKKQIKTFHEKNGYSYSGIRKSLQYFYEIKGNAADKSNGGIGIVEYCYQQSYDYFFQLYLASQINNNKDFSVLTEKAKEVNIFLQKKNKVKLIDWGIENEE